MLFDAALVEFPSAKLSFPFSLFWPYHTVELLTTCIWVWFLRMALFVSGVEAYVAHWALWPANNSQYACSDDFPHYRDDSCTVFFSSPLNGVWALLCPCRVDTVILSALNLAWLCCDLGLYYTRLHSVDFMNSVTFFFFFSPKNVPKQIITPVTKKGDKSVPVLPECVLSALIWKPVGGHWGSPVYFHLRNREDFTAWENIMQGGATDWMSAQQFRVNCGSWKVWSHLIKSGKNNGWKINLKYDLIRQQNNSTSAF